MLISLIIATGNNREMGLGGKLPWRLTEESAYFKRTTMGHHLIMGRRSFDEVGRPLPGRTTILLTSQPVGAFPNLIVASDFAAALKNAESRGESEVFVCGGVKIFEQALKTCDRIYLSRIDFSGEADTYFPEVDWGKFKLESETLHPISPSNSLPWRQQLWTRLFRS